MRRTAYFFPLAGAILVLLLSACTPETITPPPTFASEPSAETVGAPVVVTPIPLAGPELDSTMIWIDNSLLVYVPPGEFTMGESYDENPQDHPEHPQHTVYLDGFWIYRSEVTNRMYVRCVTAGQCSPPATDLPTDYLNPESSDNPVVGVSWEQADAYCRWVDGHLPTEAQWEKTARGPEGNLYPWGEAQPDCDLLNFNNCVGEVLPSGTFWSKTSPVRSYPAGASYYQALDMAGNVFEWVQDWYKSDYYRKSPAENPPGPPSGELKTVRGSGFRSTASLVPSVLRSALVPQEYRDDLGFRCVVEHPPYYAPACVYQPPTGSCPPPTLDVLNTFCEKGQGFVVFEVSEDVQSVSSDTFNCVQVEGNRYACYGAPGTSGQITVCADCGLGNETEACGPIQCADGYVLNPDTCQCEFRGVSLDGAGGELRSLVPLSIDRPCPPGRYYDALAGRCVPVNDPNDCLAATLAALIPVRCQVCPPGSWYDPETQCCQPDEGLVGAPAPSGGSCATFTVSTGECSVRKGCENPSQYTNKSSCEAARCKWANVGGLAAPVYRCINP